MSVHNGRTFTSLSIASGETAHTLVHCFGGCDTASILAAVGLSFSDLFEHQNTPRPPASANSDQCKKSWPIFGLGCHRANVLLRNPL